VTIPIYPSVSYSGWPRRRDIFTETVQILKPKNRNRKLKTEKLRNFPNAKWQFELFDSIPMSMSMWIAMLWLFCLSRAKRTLVSDLIFVAAIATPPSSKPTPRICLPSSPYFLNSQVGSQHLSTKCTWTQKTSPELRPKSNFQLCNKSVDDYYTL